MTDLSELNYNPSDHKTSGSYGPLPAGDYRLEATEGDLRDTKAGTGKVLSFRMSVLEPEQFKGRGFYLNINIRNPSSNAEKIGAEQMSLLCGAVGWEGQLLNTENVLHKAFTAQVGLERKQEGYEQRNQIKRYYQQDEGIPSPKVQPAAPVTPIGSSTGESPDRPW